MSKVKISKVILDVRGKKIELDLDEARELRNILNDTFPEKEVQTVPIYINPHPPWEPYVTEPWRPYEIWWTSSVSDTYCLTLS